MEKVNYVMLRSMLLGAHRVKEKFSHLERMPDGAICPGIDIDLMQPLAVLRYLCGVETQWSCQGNHTDRPIGHAYILLPPGHFFPKDLLKILEKSKFSIQMVKDYNLDLTETGLWRQKIQSVSNSNDFFTKKLMKKNSDFLDILNKWSSAQILEHLPKLRKEPYFKDLVTLYSQSSKVS